MEREGRLMDGKGERADEWSEAEAPGSAGDALLANHGAAVVECAVTLVCLFKCLAAPASSTTHDITRVKTVGAFFALFALHSRVTEGWIGVAEAR